MTAFFITITDLSANRRVKKFSQKEIANSFLIKELNFANILFSSIVNRFVN